jgi:hypothetical protein
MKDRRLERLRRRMVARQARQRARATEGMNLGRKYWLLVAIGVVTVLLGLIAFWRTL